MKSSPKIGLVVLAVGCVVFLVSCSNHEPPPGPSDAVRRMYSALSNQDSAELVEAAVASRREVYRKNPTLLRTTLENWKGRKAAVEIISEKNDGYVSNILYRLKISGRNPKVKDSLQVQVYNEDGTWRYGY